MPVRDMEKCLPDTLSVAASGLDRKGAAFLWRGGQARLRHPHEAVGIAPTLLFWRNFAGDRVLSMKVWKSHTFSSSYHRDTAHSCLVASAQGLWDQSCSDPRGRESWGRSDHAFSTRVRALDSSVELARLSARAPVPGTSCARILYPWAS